MVAPVKGKALVARVLVVARSPQTEPPQKTGTGTQTLETQPVLVTVGKPAPNSHRSSPVSHRRKLVVELVVTKAAVTREAAIRAVVAPVAELAELAELVVVVVVVVVVAHPHPRPQQPP